METTKPRTVNSIGMFDMLKGAGMLAIVLGHTAELYPLQLEGGLSLTAFVGFIYRETLMAAFFIASGYGFRKRSISKCIHQQLKSLLKPFCYTAVFTTVLHFIIHYKTFHYLPGSMTESIKVAGGFLLGLPHTATYFGQEFFSCGPMWYLLALLMGWILLDVILNIFPERYIPWAVGGAALLGWGASLVWELPFCLIQGAVITPYLYLGYLAKRQNTTITSTLLNATADRTLDKESIVRDAVNRWHESRFAVRGPQSGNNTGGSGDGDETVNKGN